MRQQRVLYEFQGFRIDPIRHRLSGPDGEPIRLQPKVLDTLIYLVEHAGELVDKRKLMRAVWGDTVVEENSLNQHISMLRHAFGERPSDKRFIVTIPGRGYRFVSKVEMVPQSEPEAATARFHDNTAHKRSQSAIKRHIIFGLPVLAGLVAILFLQWQSKEEPVQAHSIVVLPFIDLSESGDQAYFADGIAEEILNLLTRIPNLRVVARNSAFSFRDDDVTVEEISETLDVTHVLQGSVRSSSNRLRVGAELVDTRTSAAIWSEVYERSVGDVFEIQDDIASAVARSLQLTLLGRNPMNDRTRPEVHSLFLQARHIHNARLVESLPRAREMLERVIELDPDYFPARLVLIKVYADLGGYRFIPRGESQRLVKQALEDAEAKWPDRPELQAQAAIFGAFAGDLQEEARALERAIATNPENIETLKAAMVFARNLNRPATVAEIGEFLVSRDVLCGSCYAELMVAYLRLERYDEVERLHKTIRGLNLDPRGAYALALYLKGEYEAALAEAEKLEEYFEPRAGMRGAQLGISVLALRALHREQELDAAVAELLELLGDDPIVASVYAAIGDLDKAFEILMAQPKLHPQEFDGTMGDLMRAHPRWHDLATKAGIWPEDARDNVEFEVNLL